jgi:hypothetical protein
MPFTWALNRGRKLVASLRRGGIAPGDKLVRAVAFLEELARAWPPPAPAPALERAALAADVVEHWAVAAKSARARARDYPLAYVRPRDVEDGTPRAG